MRVGFCVLMLALGALGDVITIGTPFDSYNGDPFGAPLPGFPGTRYQQAYAAADFPGPMAIIASGIPSHSDVPDLSFYHHFRHQLA